jgi:hypothetical protein
MGDEDQKPKGKVGLKRVGDDVVTVGIKEWHVYASAIEGRLAKGPVNVAARGRKAIEKICGVFATLITNNPNVTAEITLRTGSFEKEGATIVAPHLAATVRRSGN